MNKEKINPENAKKGLEIISNLITNSQGVIGWHLNGNIAEWEELGISEFDVDYALTLYDEVDRLKEKAKLEDERHEYNWNILQEKNLKYCEEVDRLKEYIKFLESADNTKDPDEKYYDLEYKNRELQAENDMLRKLLSEKSKINRENAEASIQFEKQWKIELEENDRLKAELKQCHDCSGYCESLKQEIVELKGRVGDLEDMYDKLSEEYIKIQIKLKAVRGFDFEDIIFSMRFDEEWGSPKYSCRDIDHAIKSKIDEVIK